MLTVGNFTCWGVYPRFQAPFFLLVVSWLLVGTSSNLKGATIFGSNYLMAVVSVSSLTFARPAWFALADFPILNFSFFQTLSCNGGTLNYSMCYNRGRCKNFETHMGRCKNFVRPPPQSVIRYDSAIWYFRYSRSHNIPDMDLFWLFKVFQIGSPYRRGLQRWSPPSAGSRCPAQFAPGQKH